MYISDLYGVVAPELVSTKTASTIPSDDRIRFNSFLTTVESGEHPIMALQNNSINIGAINFCFTL
jgi:hypothetical protein